ncbi:MAG: glycine cleavage T C-terminal barrel domain-containing protein, partial [Pseudomonadota bacterium]
SSGAHLTGEAGRSEGHVTAATHSPSSGAEIALALLERGSERLGERLTMQDPLRGKTVPVEVVSPVFVDPEGRRMHG